MEYSWAEQTLCGFDSDTWRHDYLSPFDSPSSSIRFRIDHHSTPNADPRPLSMIPYLLGAQWLRTATRAVLVLGRVEQLWRRIGWRGGVVGEHPASRKSRAEVGGILDSRPSCPDHPGIYSFVSPAS